MKNELIAQGTVESLSINGTQLESIDFEITGPNGDKHSSSLRQLSGHDGIYITTSDRVRGDWIFNFRTWTALSREEIDQVDSALDVKIPPGCLLENVIVSGIPNFSKLPPTTRLVFKSRQEDGFMRPILAVWEENGPCKTVGRRLENLYAREGLKSAFISLAKNKRGLMGFVLGIGTVKVGDRVLVYPPVE